MPEPMQYIMRYNCFLPEIMHTIATCDICYCLFHAVPQEKDESGGRLCAKDN